MLHRVVEHNRRNTLVVSVLAYVPFGDPRQLLTEQVLWKDVADFAPAGIVDESQPKSRGEIVISGSAFAPKDKPVTAVMCELTISRDAKNLVHKKLAIWGDRYWDGEKISQPTPFGSMAVDWAHAYGGEGYARNPTGKGFAPVTTNRGALYVLPNVEDPKAIITSRQDRPEPAGFGSYDATWPQRFEKLGKKYDDRWLKTLFPGPAEDFDVGYYNAAPPDQQIEGFFQGGETIAIDGMHAYKRRVEVVLPRLVVRVMATQNDDSGSHFRSVGTRLDTIHVLPHLERAVLVYRAMLPVAEDDADDVEHLIVAAEDPAHPKPVEHYQRVLALRLDKEKGALASMKDEDLMPPTEAGWAAKPDYGDIAEMTRLEQRGLRKAERARKQKLEETRAELEKAGFDVAEHFQEPEQPAIPDPDDVDGIMKLADEMNAKAARMKVDMEAKKATMEADARKSFEEAGFDYDAEMKAAQDKGGGPPAFSADEHLVMLHDMARIARDGDMPMPELEKALTDPRYDQMLRDLETRVRAAYIKFAHMMPAAPQPDEAQRELMRGRVLAAMSGGEPLEGKNLSGADLHGLDLRGLNLAGALLERADLADADLSDADLTGAVLTRANLTGTKLVGANLTGANLGDTRILRTDLSAAKLDECVLMKSELDGAVLHGASLRGTDFLEVKFTQADLSHVEAESALFLQTDLRNVTFVGAKLSAARFLQVDISGVDFTGCDMSRAQLVQTTGDRANFSGARLDNAVIVHESSFNDCSFAGADLRGANLRKTPISRSNFEQAQLDGASLMGCDARGANFHAVSGREGMFSRTDFRDADLRGADLLSALLQKARLQGADLTAANLSRGDISLARIDEKTKLRDAVMVDTRIEPKYQEPKKERAVDGQG
jgi:uncharacterized protein YjbI with pentapeptide repeats